METAYNSVSEYIDLLDSDRKQACLQLQKVILENLPTGFQEMIQYKMPSYNVPHSIYPSGYHCDVKQPLPFISFASQKGGIHFYHLGIYTDQDLLNWFKSEYSKYDSNKLDMGKSCIRFKKIGQIPYLLIGELVKKMSVQDWIAIYENNIKKK